MSVLRRRSSLKESQLNFTLRRKRTLLSNLASFFTGDKCLLKFSQLNSQIFIHHITFSSFCNSFLTHFTQCTLKKKTLTTKRIFHRIFFEATTPKMPFSSFFGRSALSLHCFHSLSLTIKFDSQSTASIFILPSLFLSIVSYFSCRNVWEVFVCKRVFWRVTFLLDFNASQGWLLSYLRKSKCFGCLECRFPLSSHDDFGTDSPGYHSCIAKKQMQIILPVRLQDKKRTSEPDIKVIKKVDQ